MRQRSNLVVTYSELFVFSPAGVRNNSTLPRAGTFQRQTLTLTTLRDSVSDPVWTVVTVGQHISAPLFFQQLISRTHHPLWFERPSASFTAHIRLIKHAEAVSGHWRVKSVPYLNINCTMVTAYSHRGPSLLSSAALWHSTRLCGEPAHTSPIVHRTPASLPQRVLENYWLLRPRHTWTSKT